MAGRGERSWDIGNWLRGLGLEQYEAGFRQNEVNESVLPKLTQEAATEAAAKAIGLEAEILEVRSSDDFEGAIETAKTRHADAGVLLSSPLVHGQMKHIAELALAKRLPLICLFPQFAGFGGLIAYGPNLESEFSRCAGYAGRILHGAKPSDLPIQRPEKFDLVINLKTAEALGITVPNVLLATASGSGAQLDLTP